MTLLQAYILWAGGYACYTLGLLDGKGRTGWISFAAALFTGAVWPVAVCYGVYAVHFKKAPSAGDAP